MVAGAHADGFAIAQLGDVMRMDALDGEGDDAAAAVEIGGTEQGDALHLGQPLEGVGREVALVGAHALHADSGEVLHRRAEADGFRGGRRARLELVGQLVPGGAVAFDTRDHVAAAQEGPHRLEQLAAPCSSPMVGPSALWPVQA